MFGSLFWTDESKMELLVHSNRSRSETAIGRSLVLGMVWFGLGAACTRLLLRFDHIKTHLKLICLKLDHRWISATHRHHQRKSSNWRNGNWSWWNGKKWPLLLCCYRLIVITLLSQNAAWPPKPRAHLFFHRKTINGRIAPSVTKADILNYNSMDQVKSTSRAQSLTERPTSQ